MSYDLRDRGLGGKELGNVLTIWASSDSLVFIKGLLLGESHNLLLLFFFRSNTNVDMSDLKVHFGNKVQPSELGDDRQCCRTFPGVVNERGISSSMISQEQNHPGQLGWGRV